MPLLEDVIKLAKKNNIKIVIELKNNPEEINYYEGDIVKLIHKYNFTDSCIVESPIYKQLRNIKRLDPNIQTAFLTETLSEEYLNLEDIDVFAIDFVNLNSYWIDRIHEKDKKVPTDEQLAKEDNDDMLKLMRETVDHYMAYKKGLNKIGVADMNGLLELLATNNKKEPNEGPTLVRK